MCTSFVINKGKTIDNTNKMEKYACWKYGQHPTDEMIKGYIDDGHMYYEEKDGQISFYMNWFYLSWRVLE